MTKIEIGVFIGKFLPLHIGHVETILKYAKKCKKFFLILADSESRSRRICEEANLPEILPKNRFLWMEEIFGKVKNITLLQMDEGMLEVLPDHLEQWKSKLFDLVGTKNFTWFVDKNYLDISHKVFPEINFVGFDRTKINISATKIRQNLEANKNFLPKPVFDYLKNTLKM